MMNVGVYGAGGRIGQELLSLMKTGADFSPAVGVYGRNLGEGFKTNTQSLTPDLANKANVWIDFSQPEAVELIMNFCMTAGLPLVSGTTGMTDVQKKKLEEISKKIPVLWASNMSLGITVLRQMLSHLKGLSEFDFQIEEFHHNKKKDLPSGTAITLQQDVEKHLGRELPPIAAIRGGGIFGVHRIFAMSDEEVITLEHTALNRKVFARGALVAAQWLVKQSPGLYSMDDVLVSKSRQS